MDSGLAVNLLGFASFIPAALYAWRGTGQGGRAYWAVLAVALAGSGVVLAAELGGGWDPGFSTALWLTAFTSLLLFAFVGGMDRPARPLVLILFPYLCLIGALAVVWHGRGTPLDWRTFGGMGTWLVIHIPASLLTYGFVTLAAASALAVLLQEAALRNKRRHGFAARLPAVAVCERLELRLLVAAVAVLALGLITGMAALYAASGQLIVLDHKTLLSVFAFILLAGVLVMHYVAGLRGRLAARLLLTAYLFLTLAYPGVKFVVDVIIGG